MNVPPIVPRAPLSDGVVALRPLAERDLDALVAACQDPEIPRWTLVPSPYTRADALAFLELSRRAAEAGEALHLVAVDAARDEDLLGSAGFPALDRGRGVGEIGYWVAPWARGRGVAARCVRLLCRYGAEELGLDTVELLAHRDNAASIGVARRAGFSATGEVRPAPRTPGATDPTHLVFAWRASAPGTTGR